MLLENNNFFNFLNFLDFSSQNNLINIVKKKFRQFKLTKDINYFDSKYNDFNNTNILIINVDYYIFYRNIFVFMNCLKNLARLFNCVIRVQEFIFFCLRKNALI